LGAHDILLFLFLRRIKGTRQHLHNKNNTKIKPRIESEIINGRFKPPLEEGLLGLGEGEGVPEGGGGKVGAGGDVAVLVVRVEEGEAVRVGEVPLPPTTVPGIDPSAPEPELEEPEPDPEPPLGKGKTPPAKSGPNPKLPPKFGLPGTMICSMLPTLPPPIPPLPPIPGPPAPPVPTPPIAPLPPPTPPTPP
jgi:hypothetical protein